MDIYGFYKGECFDAYEYLGAHITTAGTVFRTYAPNASSVALVGDFNGWKDQPMERVADGRFYELLCPEAKAGMRYKYRIYDKNGNFIDHCDPYGFGSELRPGTCSVVRSLNYTFRDEKWLIRRTDCQDKPLNIYEVHLGSWKKPDISPNSDAPEWYNYAEIADELIDYGADIRYN